MPLAPAVALLLGSQLLMFLIQDQLTYIVIGLLQGLAAFVNPLPASLLGDALSPRLRARGIAVYRAVCDVALLTAPAVLGLTLQLGGFAAASFRYTGRPVSVLRSGPQGLNEKSELTLVLHDRKNSGNFIRFHQQSNRRDWLRLCPNRMGRGPVIAPAGR